MLLSLFIKQATERLEKIYPPQEARAIVLTLCAEKFGTKSYTHLIEPTYLIEPQLVISDLERLAKGEPIQYVLGYTIFRNHCFKLNADVLIPRPETEMILDLALENLAPGSKVLDLCTGSGCIAWSCLLERPDLQVIGLDISEAALDLARCQFSQNKAPLFIQKDILDSTSLLQESFDVILSNPPYIMEKEKINMHQNVLCYEPEIALFVPNDDPLRFYKAIELWAEALLKAEGIGIIEINEKLGEQTLSLFKNEKFKKAEIIQDFFGKNRFIKFIKA